jgi:adenosine deaminase/aminodeoxyfutalosine deaminase
MEPNNLTSQLATLPKAELHLHLEGAISPETVIILAARHGASLSAETVATRFGYSNFNGFLEAFKWITSFLQTPEDYSLASHRLMDELVRQNVVYAEVTLSVGVMLRRKLDVEKIFAALLETAGRAREGGLQICWIFDAARQFGPAAAMEVATWAARLQMGGVVAFGMGGDELSVPARDFLAAYQFARAQGLHVVAHAGEVGGPLSVREVVEILGAERIGHGIAAALDPELANWLIARRIPLEVCPTSNLRTGALARQLAKAEVSMKDHPLHTLFERGVRVTLSTDDPAMFQTDLLAEYGHAVSLGFTPAEIARLAENSFQAAFLPPEEKRPLLEAFQSGAKSLGLV